MSESDYTFDESQLPDWAVHGSSDQEELDAFFNSPVDRGRTGSVFAIPRGEAGAPVVSGAAPVDSDVPEPVSEPGAHQQDTPANKAVDEAKKVQEQPASTAATQGQPVSAAAVVGVSAAKTAPEAKTAPATKTETVPATKQQEAIGASSKQAAVAEVPGEVPVAETYSAKVAQDENAPSQKDTKNESPQDDVDTEQKHFGLSFGKKQGSEESAPPRREDFATFRCIYQSHDGQLALYEDEDGHLTAVNTNRFA